MQRPPGMTTVADLENIQKSVLTRDTRSLEQIWEPTSSRNPELFFRYGLRMKIDFIFYVPSPPMYLLDKCLKKVLIVSPLGWKWEELSHFLPALCLCSSARVWGPKTVWVSVHVWSFSDLNSQSVSLLAVDLRLALCSVRLVWCKLGIWYV